jgi:hypothetical protein
MPSISDVWTVPCTGAGLFVGANEFTRADLDAQGITVVVSLHSGPAWLEPASGLRHLDRHVPDGDTLPGSVDEAAVVAFVQPADLGVPSHRGPRGRTTAPRPSRPPATRGSRAPR